MTSFLVALEKNPFCTCPLFLNQPFLKIHILRFCFGSIAQNEKAASAKIISFSLNFKDFLSELKILHYTDFRNLEWTLLKCLSAKKTFFKSLLLIKSDTLHRMSL